MDRCDEISVDFNDACIESEILNFCLSVPNDSEKCEICAIVFFATNVY